MPTLGSNTISTIPRGQRQNRPNVYKALALPLLALSLLAFRAGAATNFTWDGGNADWTSTANWGGGPPGAGDTATINSGTVTVSTAVSVGTLNFSGGTLTGTGTLTVSGALTWGAVGTMSGTGTTTVLAGGTLSTSAAATKLSQRTLSNAGTWTLTGSSNVVLDTGAILNNSGTMDCQGTAGIQFNSGGGTVNNSGTIKKTTGTGTASITNIGGTGTFTNTGTVSAQSGTLQLGCGGSGTGGIYTTTGTAILNFAGGTQTLDSASSMTGTGTIGVIGGTVNMAGTITIPGTLSVAGSSTLSITGTSNSATTFVVMSTGTIFTGSGTLNVSTLMTWSGGTLSGTGTTTVLAGGTLNMSAPTSGITILNQRTLTNAGTGTITGSNDIVILTGAIFNNSGSLDCQGTAGIVYNGTAAAVNNSGTIKKTTGAGTATINDSNNTGTFTNTGTISAQSGTLQIECTGTGTGGIFTTTGTATLSFPSGTLTLDTASSLTGPGTLSVTGGTVNMAGTITIPGTLNVSSGTLSVTGTNNSAATCVVTGNGIVTGSGTLSVSSLMTWSGGTLSGTGTTTVLAGATLNMSSPTSTTILSQRTLANAGTGTMTGANSISFVMGAIFNNSGSLDCQGAGGIQFNNGGGTINNSGIFKATTTATVLIDNNNGSGTFTNTGTLSAQLGTLTLDCAFTQTAGSTALAGGTLAGTTMTFQGGTLSGAGTLSATVVNTGATVMPGGASAGVLTISGTYNQSAPGALAIQLGGVNAGTQYAQLAISGTATLGGTLNASLINSFQPAGGNTFDVLTCSSRSGTFNTFNDNGIGLSASYASNKVTLTAVLLPTISSANATTFTVGSAGTFAVTTTGSPTPSIARGGVTLPSGVTFVDNGNGTGTLAGTPAVNTNNTYALTFTANNSNGTGATQNFTLTVNPAPPLPTISSANATIFTVGSAGSFTVMTTGSPAPSIARGGVTLPSGVTFVDNGNGTGTLAGTPAVNTDNTYALTFTPTNSNGTGATQNFTLTVNPAPPLPTISSANATTFTVGSAGTFMVMTIGSPAPSIARGGVALPSGVTFVDNGNGTGTLAGTPAVNTNNTYALTFTATNANGTGATQNFTLTVSSAAPNLPPAITQLVSSQSPAKTTTVLTFTLAASDVDSATLNYTLDFGDGSAPASGSFAPNTPTPIAYAFPAAGDFNVVATVTDGVSTVSQTIVQTTIAPASGGAGVPNISNGTDTVTNPDDGLSIGVASSDGGVIELSIDASGLHTRDSLVLTTAWGDIQGRTTVVTGPHPVHGYIRHGVFVATVTATSVATGALMGKGRKSLVVSASETGEKTTPPPSARKPLPGTNSPLLGNAPNTVVNLSSMKGKFIFSGTTNDTVTFAGSFSLPLGFNPAEIHDYSMGMGNIVLNATVNGKGKGTSTTPTLKSLKLAYKLKKGQVAKGGELATVSATFTTAGMVNAGFDTEGITPKTLSTPNRGIQVAFQLDGAAYEALIPVLFAVAKNSAFGTITARHN